MHDIPTTEAQLLRVLLTDSRCGIRHIADTIGKSRNWTAHAIRRLVSERVIRSYRIIVDPSLVYVERNTVLRIKTNPREEQLSRALLEMRQLESLDGISGEHSLLALFRFRNAGEFSTFLDDIDRTVAQTRAQSYETVQVLTTYKSHGFVLQPRDAVPQRITDMDWSLLRVITVQRADQEHPFPLTQEQIGSMLEPPMSQPGVSKRLRRLEDAGVIVGYSADIDFSRVGLPIKFFLQVRPRPGTVSSTARYVSTLPEVWDLYRTGEDFSLFATVRTASISEYNAFLRRLYQHPDVIDTRSQVSLEEWDVAV